MASPIIGQLIAGFLAHHPLLDPFLAAAVFLPCFTHALEGLGRVGHFLQALVTDFGEPECDGLGFWAWNGLNQA